jgi:hypothetical protein
MTTPSNLLHVILYDHAIFSGQTSRKMSYNFVIVMYRCINKIGVLTVNIEYIGEA